MSDLAWLPASGVSKTALARRPLTARLQAPKHGADGDSVVAGFAEQHDYFEKVSKDGKASALFGYREAVAEHELVHCARASGRPGGRVQEHDGKADLPTKPVTFFAKHGRDMGFTLTSPSRESILSSKSTVRIGPSWCEADSQKQELMEEISHFERSHLADGVDLDDTPAGSPAGSPEPNTNAWRQSLVPTEAEKVSNGLKDLENCRDGMRALPLEEAEHQMPPSVAKVLQRHPSLLDIEVAALHKSGLRHGHGAPAAAAESDSGGSALSPMLPVMPGQGVGAKGVRLPCLATLPFSPPPASLVASKSPRSPRSPRRDLPGTWDAQHPDAVDHESPLYKSGAITDRTFRTDFGRKEDPLNTHRAHGLTAGACPPAAPFPVAVSDVSAFGRNAQWVRQVGQGTWQGGKVAAIAPFYQSWDVYSSARFKTEVARIRAAQDRRQQLEEPTTGAGLDPSPHAPVGPLHGPRRAWNFRYSMTHEEAVSRAFDLDTSPYGGSDSRVWRASVMRPGVAQNEPVVWPGTVAKDASLEGTQRNRTLPQGHCGDFRSTNVRLPDGTYRQRPLSPSSPGNKQTSLVVQTSKDYITEARHLTKGGRYFTDEPPLPASPSSPGAWKPPQRKPGAGWAQGVMAAASSLPPDRAQLPERSVPAYKPLAAILADHDHRGLDEASVAVQWQPFKHTRGPRHDATRWDHYLCPPGMKLFVSGVHLGLCPALPRV